MCVAALLMLDLAMFLTLVNDLQLKMAVYGLYPKRPCMFLLILLGSYLFCESYTLQAAPGLRGVSGT